jgi:hypothetical protein
MAAWRWAIELSLGNADLERLNSIAQSRTSASRVERARILLGYWKDPSLFPRKQRSGGGSIILQSPRQWCSGDIIGEVIWSANSRLR